MVNLFAQGDSTQQLLQMVPFILIVIAAYFIFLRPQQRKEQEQRAMLDALKKDDRVVTVGGIYGVVTNVRRDVDRITLRVDETNNTKLDVTFGSVTRVITDEPAGDKQAT